MITELADENFSELISSGLVLVDFYAVWCGPCKMMHPVIEEFVKDKLNKTLFKIDIKEKIPKRTLGYVIKNDIYPNFTTKKFIEILTNKL